jgi:2,4-dienoyl-CoA reductase-like NADH-dependent reductase (Old Yellow Enzyme family)
MTTTDALAEPLRLPCGVTLPNRLAKAPMTEGLGDSRLRATPRHAALYRRWAEGGAGLLITGNVMIDRRVLERPGNVAIDPTWPQSFDAEARARLADWARAGTSAGNQLWMQVSHAGRQSPRYVAWRPLAPSAVQLDLLGLFGTPRALADAEIRDLVARYGTVAAVARDCGFTGVQVHGAHGYLLSSFLSPITNRRDDEWGGPIAHRARALIEAVRATRRAVGDDFPVSVKLNSDDFRQGGYTHADCIEVVKLLNAERIDLLEISGGNYEQPRLLGMSGKTDSIVPVRESTRRREAYFLAYAESIRQVATMPLMLSGGFRTRAGMEDALGSRACDVIGLGRPLITEPDFPRRLLARECDAAERVEDTLNWRPRGVLSPTSPWLLPKLVNVQGAMGWYYHQIFRLADGLDPDRRRGVLRSFAGHWIDELATAARLDRG